MCLGIVLASCSAPPPREEKPGEWTPTTSLTYLKDLLRAEEFGKAHYMLDPRTQEWLKRDPFVALFYSYPTLRRALLKTEIRNVRVRGNRAKVRLCNPILGLDHEFEMIQHPAPLWTLHVPEGLARELSRDLERGIAAQFDRAGGYHVFPPDYAFPSKSTGTDCEASANGEENP